MTVMTNRNKESDSDPDVYDLGSSASWAWVKDSNSGESNGAHAQMARLLSLLEEGGSEEESQAAIQQYGLSAAQQSLATTVARYGARDYLVAARLGLGV